VSGVRRWLWRIFPWLLLWGAFAAFGWWVRSVQPWPEGHMDVVELYAMDYRRYSQLLDGWNMIFYAAFRHPLYGWLMAPVIGIGARFRELGEEPFWGWLIAFFSGVMTLAHFLLYWLLCRLSLKRLEAAALTALFASFAASWLLAACPESFNLSCLLALSTLHFALYVRHRGDATDRRLEYAGWGALAVLTGGITCTQIMKTAMAYFVTCRPSRKRICLTLLGLLGAGLVVGLVFLARLYLRSEPGGFGREFATSLNNIGEYLVGGGTSFSHRMGRIFVFFTEPIVTRGAAFSETILPTGYASRWAFRLAVLPVISAMVFACCSRREFIVRVIAAMALVDIGIHFVLFWGMNEAQIYAGHWYYAVPILIGVGILQLNRNQRRWAPAVVFCLALAILVHNLAAWLS